ncbi:ImpA family type VI secretion system protein [Piscinibacter sp.]|uniref:type VI secretion system protein TssA n=1 Tax=Piscinibacter sp. TaxID=1903157 RepID=UPI002BB1FF2E|nr:type VI secretion system ImpA family N-terminal domain-containing protein [Albitalea sp.]HUG21868.1 type VI secretion system ImpA family N-terminal domain-containing protein [Albitalea sp.]
MHDIGPLLRPLPGDDPCGLNLAYDPVIDAIGRARDQPDERLPTGVWERAPNKHTWATVESLCANVLLERSKDLQIAAWLCEAWAHEHGMNGFAEGVRLLDGMARIFWEGAHPRIESDGDTALRVRPFHWIEQAAMRWLQDERVLGAAIVDAATAAAAGAASAQLLQLGHWLDERLGVEAPGFSTVCQRLNALAGANAAVGVTSRPSPAPIAAVGTAASPGSREAAYAQLRDIAAYLAQAEPHSPAATILEALVAWRADRFEDLLARLPNGEHSIYTLAKLFTDRKG